MARQPSQTDGGDAVATAYFEKKIWDFDFPYYIYSILYLLQKKE